MKNQIFNFIVLMFVPFVGISQMGFTDPVFYETEVTQVEITIYYAEEDQTDDTPMIPSCPGYRMDKGKKYIAVSRDFKKYSTKEFTALECGDRVRLCCEGCPYEDEYTVVDVMNKRFKRYVDVFTDPTRPYGSWTGTLERI